MEQINSAQAIKFGDEILVEIQGTDEHNVIAVKSYQFAFEEDEQALIPKESVDEEHVSIVRDTLQESGFHWVTVTG